MGENVNDINRTHVLYTHARWSRVINTYVIAADAVVEM